MRRLLPALVLVLGCHPPPLGPESALDAYLDALAKNNLGRAWELLSADYRKSHDRAAFERAVAADPNSAAAHYYLGYTIYKIAEPKRHDSPGKKEAAAEFAKAYELDPGFKPVWGSRRG